MITKKRNIEVVSTKLSSIDGKTIVKISFVDILRFLNKKEFRLHGKIFELTLIKTKIQNCVLGIIVTTQDSDIPPIRNKATKMYSKVSIDPRTQGLAFANIFLFDYQRNIFLYEINKNGCFLNQFREFIYSKWNPENPDKKFSISFPAIFRKNEYNRMLGMNYYKKLTVELLSPSELLNCFEEETDSIQNNILKYNILAGKANNANTLLIEQVALQKKINPFGLSRTLVKDIVDSVKLNLIDKGFKNNINTLKIEGYSDDVEGSKSIKKIDLLGDTFKEYIKITDIQVQTDVQQFERKEGIENLYTKLLPEFIQILG